MNKAVLPGHSASAFGGWCATSSRFVFSGRSRCGLAAVGPCRVLQAKGDNTNDALESVVMTDAGDNPLTGASDTRSLEGRPHASVWFSSTVIHYTGNGLWTVGFVPHPTRSKNDRWQWIHDLSSAQAQVVLGENRNRIVRCDTEEVRQILRGCP